MEFMSGYSEAGDSDDGDGTGDGDASDMAREAVVKDGGNSRQQELVDRGVVDSATVAEESGALNVNCPWLDDADDDSSSGTEDGITDTKVKADKAKLNSLLFVSAADNFSDSIPSAKNIFDLDIAVPKYLISSNTVPKELTSYTKATEPNKAKVAPSSSASAAPKDVNNAVAKRALSDALFQQLQQQGPKSVAGPKAAGPKDKETVKVSQPSIWKLILRRCRIK
jgi:hypothetical protein